MVQKIAHATRPTPDPPSRTRAIIARSLHEVLAREPRRNDDPHDGIHARSLAITQLHITSQSALAIRNVMVRKITQFARSTLAITRSHAVLAREPRRDDTIPKLHAHTGPRDRTTRHMISHNTLASHSSARSAGSHTSHDPSSYDQTMRCSLVASARFTTHTMAHARDTAPHDQTWRSRDPWLNRTAPSRRAGAQQERGLGVLERLAGLLSSKVDVKRHIRKSIISVSGQTFPYIAYGNLTFP